MIDIISFIFFKLLAVVGMLIVWGLPLAFAWLAISAAREAPSTTQRRAWLAVIVVFFGLGTPTYWAWLIPGSSTNLDGKPLDTLYHFTVSGFEEHLKKQEATKPPSRTNTGIVLKRYRLDGWNPPKHFYVDLTEMATGKKYDQLYVSKHCNTAQLVRGDEYNLELMGYTLSNRPGETFYEFRNLTAAFCN